MKSNTKTSQQEQKNAFKVRDERKPGHHWADNELMDIYAPKIGIDGYSVYMYLARHAGNRDGRCSKSLGEIAAAFKTSSDTVYRALKKLMDHSLVAKYEIAGKPSVYILLEVPKSKSSPTADSGDHQPHTAVTTMSPTANSGDYPPLTAAPPPLLAVTPPLTAAPNKEERLFQDFPQNLNLSNSTSELRKTPSRDVRFCEVNQAIEVCWPKGFKYNPTVADHRAISRMLAANPAWKAAELAVCIVARFHTDGNINPTESPKAWIGAITDYQSGPRNRFNKEPLYTGDALESWRTSARTILYGPQPEQLTLKPSGSVVSFPADLETADASDLWAQVLIGIQSDVKNISRLSFDTWLKPTKGFGRRGPVFYVQVPTAEFRQLGLKFGELIRREFEVAGVTDVKFLTSDELANHNWNEQRTA